MKSFHIFISHAWRYSEDYSKVVDWLNEAQAEGKLTWSNYSVPQHDPLIDQGTSVGKKKLQGLLEAQIRPASKIIVLSGMYAAYSNWIDFEVDTSVSMGYYLGEDGKRHRKTVSKSFTRRRDAVNALPAIGISKVSAKSEKKAKTTFKEVYDA